MQWPATTPSEHQLVKVGLASNRRKLDKFAHANQ